MDVISLLATLLAIYFVVVSDKPSSLHLLIKVQPLLLYFQGDCEEDLDNLLVKF